MKHYIFLPLLGSFASAAHATVVFSDDFNRADLGSVYVTTVKSGDGGASINGGAFVELTNDATATVNASGRVSVATAFSNFAAPFSGKLTDNASTVTWETNLRFNRASAPSGFASGEYGVAFVLAASDADFTQGNGYAVVYGNALSPDPFRLVRYTGGLSSNTSANITNLFSSGASDLAAVNNYASVRVTYNRTGNVWALYVRDDGASAWADPATMDAGSLKGTATDSTYSGTALTHAGFLWNHATGVAQTVQFDNLRVSAVPEPASYGALGAGVLGALALLRRRRRAG